jgi:hypothetical protein
MQKETCGIYVITERATERTLYVGQSIGIEGRWKKYKNRFPKARFDYRIIQECLPAELNFWEKYYIRAFKTHWSEGGENQDWGGQHWPKPEEPHSPATRAKISASKKGVPLSEEHKAKCSATQKGRVKGPLSEEQKAKQSAVMKGRVRGPMPEEEKAKRRGKVPHNKGMPMSEEQKAKLSATLTGRVGRVQSEETRAKISVANKGQVSPNKGMPMPEEQKAKLRNRVVSEETKAKNSAAAKAQAVLRRAAKAAAVAALEALLFAETETILSPE